MDLFLLPQNRDFYNQIMEINNNNMQIHCSALFVGDEMIATNLGIIHNKIFYYLMPAYEGGDWIKYSPGRLLLEYLLESSIYDRISSFDFTIGGEPYKMQWCENQIGIYELVIPKSFKGKIYYLFFKFKDLLRKFPQIKIKLIKVREWLKTKFL